MSVLSIYFGIGIPLLLVSVWGIQRIRKKPA
jgi:thiol:disulfide interchange protein